MGYIFENGHWKKINFGLIIKLKMDQTVFQFATHSISEASPVCESWSVMFVLRTPLRFKICATAD